MSYPKSPKKLALITGGANGIGLATAQQLAKQNYDLFLIDKDEENLKIAQSLCSECNSPIHSL
ncbi:MAG: SDR family NAD(P)-dependent oxidoreductase [Streptomycetaceae bacterium]|nr:SDR family NAD(P)-dependent oxidoreductase [Streptomycetaceae bacterium]